MYLDYISDGSKLVLIVYLSNSCEFVILIKNEMPSHCQLMIFSLESSNLHFVSLGKNRIGKMLTFSKENCL